MTEEDKNTAANDQLWKREILTRPAGGDGIARYADTSLHTADIYAIAVEEGTVIATLTPAAGFTSSGLTGVALPAQTLFGRWTALQLTSGAAVCNLLT